MGSGDGDRTRIRYLGYRHAEAVDRLPEAYAVPTAEWPVRVAEFALCSPVCIRHAYWLTPKRLNPVR